MYKIVVILYMNVSNRNNYIRHEGFFFLLLFFMLTFQPKVSVTFLSLRKTCLSGSRVLKPQTCPVLVKHIFMDEN